MLPMLEEYVERLQALHIGISQTVEGLPPPALDWVPGPETNSLGVLAVHVAGSERFWIGDMAGKDPSGRDREAEFHTRGLESTTLADRLAETLEHSCRVLERLTTSDLEATRVSPRDGHHFTVAWCLVHALEHTSLHLGHMQLTRQLWEQRERTPQ